MSGVKSCLCSAWRSKFTPSELIGVDTGGLKFLPPPLPRDQNSLNHLFGNLLRHTHTLVSLLPTCLSDHLGDKTTWTRWGKRVDICACLIATFVGWHLHLLLIPVFVGHLSPWCPAYSNANKFGWAINDPVSHFMYISGIITVIYLVRSGTAHLKRCLTKHPD